jgi:two-component system, OmpR family, phosphate regulon sensor histidine kinase PhoR
MHKKLKISRLLMMATLLLITLFQVYWLRKVYKDSYLSLKREISVVLRESLVRDQMQTLFGDSANNFVKRDSFTIGGNQIGVVQMMDSGKGHLNWQHQDSVRIEIYRGKGKEQRPQGIPSPRFMAFESGSGEDEVKPPLTITMPVNQKSFEEGKLPERYMGILQTSGLPHVFTIHKSEKQPGGRAFRFPNRMGHDGSAIEFLLADFDFGNPVKYILSKMYGQIAVAIFMTAMVMLAFRFMYRSLREQVEMATLKNDFISNMTHELKTPIATVSVAIEALKNFSAIDNPQRTREYLDISSSELNRLSLLIDKVLRINMFEAEKWMLDVQPVDLVSLTEEVVQTQQLQAEKITGIIDWTRPGHALVIKGDKLHLMSVLYNLLDNALKYRTEHPVIKVLLYKENDNIIWQVQDNGPGIAAEYRSRVFEKFFRVPHGDRHDVKGYGLGLSYVHEVVQKHGGKITVESEPGKGSTFTVILPAT